MKRLVEKQIKWDASHRLVRDYPGLCRSVHGHMWSATIVMEGVDLDKYGFVKDFNDFQRLKRWVDEYWDHGVLVSDTDFEWIDWLKDKSQRYFEFRVNPTSEIIAEHLFKKASEFLNDENAKVVEVRISETPTSTAIYRQECLLQST